MGKNLVRGIEIVGGAAEIAAGIYFHQPGLVVSGALTFAQGVTARAPNIAVGKINLLDSQSSPTTGLPIPYGKTGIKANTDGITWTSGLPGQPVFGTIPVAMSASADQNYLYLLVAVCHGPVQTVDSIFLNDRLAARYVTATGLVGVTAPRMQAFRMDGTIEDGAQDFTDVVVASVAYGTDGQAGTAGPDAAWDTYAITGSTQIKANQRFLTTAVPHPFQVGDAVMITNGGAGLGLAVAGNPYLVIDTHTNDFTVYDPLGAGGTGSLGSPIAQFAPGSFGVPLGRDAEATGTQIANVFANSFPSASQGMPLGKGVVYIAIRCTADSVRFRDGIPKVTVGVSGICGEDPRTERTINIASVEDVSGTPTDVLALNHNVRVTFTGAHGLAEGDLIKISGVGILANRIGPVIDGIQRVDRLESTTQIRIYIGMPGVVGTDIGHASIPFTLTPDAFAVTLSPISNPIIGLRDYLLNNRYGLGADPSEIDDTEFTTAANYCDATIDLPVPDSAVFMNTRTINSVVPGGGVTTITVGDGDNFDADPNPEYVGGATVMITGTSDPTVNGTWTISSPTDNGDGTGSFTIPVVAAGTLGPEGATATVLQAVERFAISGILNSNDSLKTNIDHLLTSCRGVLVYQVGRYFPSIRQATSPALALDQTDIVGDWQFSLPGSDQMINVIRGTYIEPLFGWQFVQNTYPPPNLTNGFLADDENQYSIKDIEFPLIDDKARSTTLLQVIRRESRIAKTVSVTCKERAMQLSVNDLVTITHETPGWVAQPCWVNAITPLTTGLVNLTLETYDATSYDLDAIDSTPFAVVTNLPTPDGLQLPNPTITIEQEGTALDGDGEGLVHVLITFEGHTDSIYIYASESAASGGNRPDITANGLAGIVTRHEGATASALNWSTEFDVATTESWYRQLTIFPQNSNGDRGTPQKFEVQAIDTGTGPSAKPTGLAVDLSTPDQATITWTVNDALANHRVWRNGYVLTRVDPTVATFVDRDISATESYRYNVQAIRNGQTSEFAVPFGTETGGTSGTPTLTPPEWGAPTPLTSLYSFFTGRQLIAQFANHNPGSVTEIWMNNQPTDGGTFSPVGLVAPGLGAFLINGPQFGVVSNETRWFKLTAVATGFTSADSIHVPGDWTDGS